MKKLFLVLLILFSLQIFTSCTLTIPQTYTLGIRIQYVSKINNNLFLIWHSDNIIRQYNSSFYSSTILANISGLSPTTVGNNLMTAISSSDSENIIAGVLGRTICWYNKTSGLASCNQGTTIPSEASQIQFTQKQSKVIVCMSLINGCMIIDLNLPTSNKTISYLSVSDKVSDLKLNINNLTIYGVLNNGKVITIDLDSTSSSYHQIQYTTIPTLLWTNGNKVIGLANKRKVVISDTSTNIISYDLYNNPPTKNLFGNYSSNVVSIIQSQQTFITISGFGSVQQWQFFSDQSLSRMSSQLPGGIICNKIIKNATSTYVLLFQYDNFEINLVKIDKLLSCTMNNCLSCYTFNNDNYCSKCNLGYMRNYNYLCQQCSSFCQQCINTTAQGCTSCNVNYEIINQTIGCVSVCLNNQTRINGTCITSCSSNCLTCINTTAQGCTSCNVGYEITNQTTGCVSVCLNNQTRINGTCITSCSSNCLTCINTTAQGCTSCNVGYEITNQTTGCVSVCLNNQTRINGTCITSCSSNCLTCINTTAQGCTSCNVGYEITNQTTGCVSVCLNNQTRINGTCITSCSSNCLTCINTTAQGCTSCNVGYEITNQTTGCVSVCLNNQTRINGTCITSCSSNCLTCINTTAQGCTSCNVGYEITNQTTGCVSVCLNNQTRINGTCITSCSSNCLTCINTTAQGCTSCNVGYEITNQTTGCVSVCLNNQTRINGTCITSCSSNCLTCINTTAQGCTSCNVGYEITNQTTGCVSVCLNNQTRINGTCITSCSSNCLTCINTTAQGCTSCNVGYEITNQTTGCVTSCLPNTIRLNGTCVYACMAGFYFDFNTNTCLSCSKQCKTCNSSGCLQIKFFYQVNSNGKVEVYRPIEVVVQFFSIPSLNSFTNSFSLTMLVTDRLWFYQYHNRTYGIKVSNFFQIVRYYENDKFLPIYSNEIENDIKSLLPDWNSTFQQFQPFTIPRYYYIQRKDGTIMNNLQNFFTITLPITILSYLLFRMIFFCLWNYKISYYLRSFSFGGTLMISLIQPNIQYTAYLAMNQMLSQSSSRNSYMKVTVIVWISVFFLVVIYSLSWYFICYYLYQKLSKYFAQSCYRLQCSFWWLTIQIGLKNILLGFIHSGVYNNYSIQIFLLSLIELISIICSIYMLVKYDCFKVKLTHFCRILASALFILLQLTLYLDNSSDQTVNSLFDSLEYQLIKLIGISCIIYSVADFIVPFLQCQQKQQQISQQQSQSISNDTSTPSVHLDRKIRLSEMKYLKITGNQHQVCVNQQTINKYLLDNKNIKSSYQLSNTNSQNIAKYREIINDYNKTHNLQPVYNKYNKSLQSTKETLLKNSIKIKGNLKQKISNQKNMVKENLYDDLKVIKNQFKSATKSINSQSEQISQISDISIPKEHKVSTQYKCLKGKKQNQVKFKTYLCNDNLQIINGSKQIKKQYKNTKFEQPSSLSSIQNVQIMELNIDKNTINTNKNKNKPKIIFSENQN